MEEIIVGLLGLVLFGVIMGGLAWFVLVITGSTNE